MWDPNARLLEQLLLEVIHLEGGAAHVEQDDLGVALHQPTAAVDAVSKCEFKKKPRLDNQYMDIFP